MTAVVTGRTVPAHWPAALAPDALAAVRTPTPYLITDLSTVADQYHRFRAALPGIRPHYAMKCNSSPEILRTLADLGGGFEVASLGELKMLQYIGVDPADVLYSNPIKPPAHVAAAHAAGLWRFSFDSPGELNKLAAAPRLARCTCGSTSRTAQPVSVVAQVRHERTKPSVCCAGRELGLRPYGVTFHVGSQCTDPSMYSRAIDRCGLVMAEAARADGIRIEMLNIGGGCPARYVDPVPDIERDRRRRRTGARERLPYRPPSSPPNRVGTSSPRAACSSRP